MLVKQCLQVIESFTEDKVTFLVHADAGLHLLSCTSVQVACLPKMSC